MKKRAAGLCLSAAVVLTLNSGAAWLGVDVGRPLILSSLLLGAVSVAVAWYDAPPARKLAHRENAAPGTLCLCLHPMQDHNEHGCRFKPCGCERFTTRRVKLDEMEEALAKATPGRWRWEPGGTFEGASFEATVLSAGSDAEALERGIGCHACVLCEPRHAENAALIAAAVNALPALLRVARAAAMIPPSLRGESLRAALRDLEATP